MLNNWMVHTCDQCMEVGNRSCDRCFERHCICREMFGKWWINRFYFMYHHQTLKSKLNTVLSVVWLLDFLMIIILMLPICKCIIRCTNVSMFAFFFVGKLIFIACFLFVAHFNIIVGNYIYIYIYIIILLFLFHFSK